MHTAVFMTISSMYVRRTGIYRVFYRRATVRVRTRAAEAMYGYALRYPYRVVRPARRIIASGARAVGEFCCRAAAHRRILTIWDAPRQ